MGNTIVIFGASGDLTRRKLIPALYRLFEKGRLPEGTRVLGVSRSRFTDAEWRQALKESARDFLAHELEAGAWQEFANRVFYESGDINERNSFRELDRRLTQDEGGGDASRVYYLATAPGLYKAAIETLGMAGMADETRGRRRIVVEKPFGVDAQSARSLNDCLHGVFEERQVFRIDHYLGKETVQNLMVFRFANSIFEPIWNRNYIDHVQITMAEEVTIGSRGEYYDSSGVLRDMFQNHLLQLMMITAMEAPVRFEANLVRDEKVKVLRAVRSMAADAIASDTVRGQYKGYRAAEGVAEDSRTATFGALVLHIDNWRWKGVPFYLRSGKAMSCRTTQIVIQFREPPHLLFGEGSSPIDANRLIIQIQPAEGIQLHFQTKVPDEGMRSRTTDLDFRFAQQFSTSLPDAYQRLLLDVLLGDASLFARSDEIELAWGIVDPIQQAWDGDRSPPLESYDPGGWGPTACDAWIRAQGHHWFDVCPVLH